MSTQYNGQAANVTVPAAVQINSSTNASPIVLTTYVAHGMATGDTVNVYGHATNTAANGTWTVIVLSATTLSLTGSTGNGVGTTSGFVQSLGLGATYAIPSDGDADNAASVNVAFETLGDRTAMLAANIGQMRELTTVTAAVDDPTGFAAWTAHTFAVGSTWEWVQGAPLGTAPIAELTKLLNMGDVIDVSLTASCYWVSSSGSILGMQLALGYAFYSFGTAIGTPGKILGSGQVVGTAQVTGVTRGEAGINLRGTITNSAIGDDSLAIYLLAFTRDTTPADCQFYMESDYIASITVKRPTAFALRNG